MNRLGIMADVSHASDQTTWDILETSRQPVIASHSNARALMDHPRNLTDDMIRAIAASGGVVGVVAVAGYIADVEPTIARWADHVDHIVNLVGIDHVAVGCEFYEEIAAMGASFDIPSWSPWGELPALGVAGMSRWPELPGLTAGLLRRGYDEAALCKLYGSNFLSVLTATENQPTQAQS
jgi:membrane dipeptidase